MQALTQIPGMKDLPQRRQIPAAPREGSILLEAPAVGLCGTDLTVAAEHGPAPKGEPFLVGGHESLCRVQDPPTSSGSLAGDRVVGIVRRPAPVPSPARAQGERHMCRDGRFTQHGIGPGTASPASSGPTRSSCGRG